MFSSVALAQPVGEVESIGFGQHIRPDAWTPMVVRITPDSSQTATYQIRVEQEDLDRDRVVFTRTITLTGNAEGQPVNTQRFWMYFIPQPTQGGLPSTPAPLRDLQARLKVSLYSDRGRFIAPLDVRTTVVNIDPPRGAFDTRRGVRFILAVGEPGLARPNFVEYVSALGIMEEPRVVHVQTRELPESVIGYDAVDAVLWLNADPPDALQQADERRRNALREYVREGGRLIISQPAERDRTAAFRDLLPVTVVSMEDRNDLAPLRRLARAEQDERWNTAGTYRAAIAEPKPGALVVEWMHWDQPQTDGQTSDASADGQPGRLPSQSPWLVRMPYGLGSVTWVAQDLGDPALASRQRDGWAHVWDRVFDWKNSTLVVTPRTPQEEQNPWAAANAIDLGGGSMLSAIEHGARSTGLVFLAMLFFMLYWAIAGPGMYLFLVNRRRSHMSWFLFAVAGLVATALTVLVVQLVLRGPPQARHVSVVQSAQDGPSIVHSRIGLYIPRDGMQRIELHDTAQGAASFITPLAIHPHHLTGDIDFPARLGYEVSLDELLGGAGAAIEIPYRSTLKKIEARWNGQLENTVAGQPRLLTQSEAVCFLDGTLYNATGRDLEHVYFAFSVPVWGQWQDWMLYLPRWEDGRPLDLRREFSQDEPARSVALSAGPLVAVHNGANRLRGLIGRPGRGEGDWDAVFYSWMRGGGFGMGELVRSDADRFGSFFVMMSLFDRFPPARRTTTLSRFELQRRGHRHLDLSHAIGDGRLVVLAQSAAPLPLPLNVEGAQVAGEGRTYYQYVLPLDRSAYGQPSLDPQDDPGQEVPETEQPQPPPEVAASGG